MAISRILHINSHEHSSSSHLQVAINYILKDEKTMNGLLTGSVNCIKEDAYENMKATKKLFGKTDKRQGYHLIISFEENECDENTAMKVIQEFVNEYLESDYEAVYAVHNNTSHIHGHIIWNSVRFTDGYKYHYKKGDWERDIQSRVDRICEKYGLNKLEVQKDKEEIKNNKEWDQLKDGPFVWNEQIKKDIDANIIRAYDFESFIVGLENQGYQIKYGKYLAIKPPEMKKFRRLKTLGEGYSEEEIKVRITKEDLKSYRRSEIIGAPRINSFKSGRIRKRKLTGLQKENFNMMYQLGKIKKRPYSQAWKYKRDVNRFEYLQRQYLYLSHYDINKAEEIPKVQSEIRNKIGVLNKAKDVITEEMEKHFEVFNAVDVIENEKNAYMFYKTGDETFRKSAKVVEAAKQVLKENNISFKEAKKLKEHYEKLMNENKSQIKKMRLEISTGYRILKEIKEKELKREYVENKEHDIDKKQVKRR